MSGFTAAESNQHFTLVASLVRYLESNGWKVTHADGVSNYPRPAQVVSHIPDVRATKQQGNLVAYGEAETCETLGSEQTRQQIDEFSNRVMTNTNQPVPLFIIVPQRCYSELQNVIKASFSSRSNITLLYLPSN